jgi:hypothetical protein
MAGEVMAAPPLEAVYVEPPMVTLSADGTSKISPEERSAQALTQIAHTLAAINVKLERLLTQPHQDAQSFGPQSFGQQPAYAPGVPQYAPGGAPVAPAGGWNTPSGPDPRASWVCPIHGTGARHVPAGNRKSDGKPYPAFWACVTQGCRQRVG